MNQQNLQNYDLTWINKIYRINHKPFILPILSILVKFFYPRIYTNLHEFVLDLFITISLKEI
jgi:hypothetical protein